MYPAKRITTHVRTEEHEQKQIAAMERRDELQIVGAPRKVLRRAGDSEVGILATVPDIRLLRWLPTLKYETGLFLWESNWYALKGSSDSIFSGRFPADAEVILHSHPFSASETHRTRSFPSPGDFINGPQTAKALIASSYGITQYWPVNEESRKAITSERVAFFLGGVEMYLQFLEHIGARFEVHLWKEVDKQRLGELLRPCNALP